MEYGDELMLDGFKVPWLFWIQLVVTFLLFILLFFVVTLLTLDASAAPPTSSAFSSAAPVNSDSLISVVKDEDVGEEGGRGREDCLATEEDRDGDESQDPVVVQFLRGQIHPCGYMKAIFKCFGFDSSSKNSHRKAQQDKQD